MIFKITIARNVEENAFFFLFFYRLSWACRAKYQGRMYLCPVGINQVIISTKYLIQRKFKSATICYYKVRQPVITKCDAILLQSATSVITKCEDYYKGGDSFITKCDDYYKVRQNTCSNFFTSRSNGLGYAFGIFPESFERFGYPFKILNNYSFERSVEPVSNGLVTRLWPVRSRSFCQFTEMFSRGRSQIVWLS